jgi:hypothetical protein
MTAYDVEPCRGFQERQRCQGPTPAAAAPGQPAAAECCRLAAGAERPAAGRRRGLGPAAAAPRPRPSSYPCHLRGLQAKSTVSETVNCTATWPGLIG